MGNLDLEIHFFRLIGSAPLFVVWLAGALLCVFSAARHPQACTLVGIALALAVGTSLVLPFISTWIFNHGLGGLHELKWRIFLDGLFFSIPRAAAWALMLWAVFGARLPAQRGALWPGDAHHAD